MTKYDKLDRLYLAGEWRDGSGKALTNVSPWDESTIFEMKGATADDVDEAYRASAEAQAKTLLQRLNISERLWQLSPTTFSGGEQQRVNIARGFAYPYPALLLDEPTASLDPVNRATVLKMIAEAKARGAAIIGIFHDHAARDEICDRQFDVTRFTPGLAA